MRVNEDYETWNAAVQVNDPDSVRNFWKIALQRRKKHTVLVRPSLFLYASLLVHTTDHHRCFPCRFMVTLSTSPPGTSEYLLTFAPLVMSLHSSF